MRKKRSASTDIDISEVLQRAAEIFKVPQSRISWFNILAAQLLPKGISTIDRRMPYAKAVLAALNEYREAVERLQSLLDPNAIPLTLPDQHARVLFGACSPSFLNGMEYSHLDGLKSAIDRAKTWTEQHYPALGRPRGRSESSQIFNIIIECAVMCGGAIPDSACYDLRDVLNGRSFGDRKLALSDETVRRLAINVRSDIKKNP